MKNKEISTKQNCLDWISKNLPEVDLNSFFLEDGLLFFYFKDNKLDRMSDLDCTSKDGKRVLRSLERFMKNESEQGK